MDWKTISKQPTLSEEFMREHANRLDWIRICLKQDVSPNFMKEMVEYIFLDILRQRLQNGTLPSISQGNFMELEECYKKHWEKKIRTLGGLFEPKYFNGDMEISKTKIKIPFQLDETIFPSSHSYTRLSFSFKITDRVSDYTINESSHLVSKTTDIPLSTLFSTEQQKDAFFYCINLFLLHQNVIKKPIIFYY